MDFDYTNETITPDTTGSINIGGTGAFGVPIGTTAQANTPSAGLIRYDSTINQLTWSNASNWTTLSTGNTSKVSTLAATTADLAAASNTASALTGTLVVFPAQDGITLALNNRLLVKNQTAPAQNGIYTLTTVGVAATTAWVLTRSIDADVISELASAIVSVDSGTLNGGLVYCNNTKTTDTLGTTAVTWSRNVDVGYLPTYLASPPAIGGTAAAAGKFSNLEFTGTLTVPNTTVVSNLNADLLDGNHASVFLKNDVATTLIGVGQTNTPIFLNITSPGVGYESGFNFLKNTDSAGISVAENTTDATVYEFFMWDNPDGGDFFSWRFGDWQGGNALWNPLLIGELESKYTARNHSFYGNIVQPLSGAYFTTRVIANVGTAANRHAYNSLINLPVSVAGTITITALNVTGFTGTSGAAFFIKFDSTTTFGWGYGSWQSPTYTQTGLSIASPPTLSNGVIVTFSGSTGGVLADSFQCRIWLAAANSLGATTINSTVKLPNVGTSGFVKLGAGGQLSADTNVYGTGTVTSVGFTGGLISVATSTATPALTVAGTSGGIPYFSSGTTWASSTALIANALVIGGGAGAAPSTITTGTGVVTALGIAVGTAGSFVVNGGVLGTPSSGTVTNLTGTASININGTVGATTANTGAFTTLSAKGTTATDAPTLGTEFITGGAWTSTGWTGDNTTGWVNGASNVSPLSYSVAAVASTRYQISYTVTGYSAGSFTVAFGGQSYTTIISTGTFGPTATTTGNLVITPTSTFVGTIVISIKAISTASTALLYAMDSSSTVRYEQRVSSAANNTFIGTNAGKYNTTGVTNSAVGLNTLQNNTTGFQNSAFGTSALAANTTGYSNSAFGVSALLSNISGENNSAVGYFALYANTTGFQNTALGWGSLRYNTSGSNNTSVGISSLQNNVTGSGCVAVGYNALYNNTASNNVGVGTSVLSSNTIGLNNSALGYQSLYFNDTGSSNSAFGHQSLYSNLVNANTAFGYFTLKSNTIGTANTAVGTQSLYFNTTVVTSLGTVTGGTGYTNGTYTNVQLTYVSGSGVTTGVGVYPTATIVVSGGVVATVTLTTYGSCFKDSTTVFSCAAASVGGTGTGFSVPSNSMATGINNTAVGYQSLYSNTIGIQNLALGLNTLRSNTFGSNNVSLGVSSLNYNTTGNGNTANGTFALQNNITGSNNVALGQNSATYIADGVTGLSTANNSTYIGASTKASANNVTNETVIGYNTTGSGSNTTTIGGSTLLASPPLSTAINNEVVTASWVINKYGTIVLNDISTQFDGSKNVFDLLQDQTPINSVVDSKDLDVTINGMRLSPYVDKYTYPWLTPFDSFNGFRVINVPDNTTGLTTVGKIIIYNAPYIGDYGSCILRQISTTRQKQKYPFTATTIALGD